MAGARGGRGTWRGPRVVAVTAVVAAGAFVGLAGPSGAQDPLCDTASVARRQTDFAPVPVTVKQFSPSLGTLTSVSVTRTIASDQNTDVESREETAKTYQMKATVTVSITSPAFVGQLDPLSTTSTAVTDLGPFDGVVDFAGTSGKSGVIAVAPEASDGQSSTDPTTLANFTGDGAVTFTVDSVGEATFAGPGNADYRVSTFASATVTVCYAFAPPATTTVAATTVATTTPASSAPSTTPPRPSTSVPQTSLAVTGASGGESKTALALVLLSAGGVAALIGRATTRRA